jgi:opacity protein-like surface antigen
MRLVTMAPIGTAPKAAIAFLLGAGSLLAGVPFASAADIAKALPAPAAPVVTQSWTQLYVGGDIGYGINVGGLNAGTDTSLGSLGADLAGAPRGMAVEGIIGYDKQVSPLLVLGLRASLGYANLQGGGAAGVPNLQTLSIQNATNYLCAVDGIAGVIVAPHLMVTPFVLTISP